MTCYYEISYLILPPTINTYFLPISLLKYSYNIVFWLEQELMFSLYGYINTICSWWHSSTSYIFLFCCLFSFTLFIINSSSRAIKLVDPGIDVLSSFPWEHPLGSLRPLAPIWIIHCTPATQSSPCLSLALGSMSFSWVTPFSSFQRRCTEHEIFVILHINILRNSLL